ncbi:MAG TPA: DUF4185 domain-containing protein [Thermodesulfobacteriota bacterium]|nr:DUF4185 domain-containing protein [Thermodesulfobacteriota bacterium]
MRKLLGCVCAVAAAWLGMAVLVKEGGAQARQDWRSTQAMENHITYVQGSSKKVCQLTGETDHEFHKPTVSQTETRFGLKAADHGYSFEHHGKLFFLFGDTVPTRTFHGRRNGPNAPTRNPDFNDAIAFTTDTTIENCVKLDFIRNSIGAFKNPVVLNAQGQPAVKLRTNESPISGISEGGRMYVIFGTDNPTDTAKRPGPLGYPTRTVVAVSEDDANTFHYLYDFSKGPCFGCAGGKFINIAIARASDGYLYFWGTQGGELYRKSAPYLARIGAEDFGRRDGWRYLEYFAGLDQQKMPRFSKSEADAAPLFEDYADDPSKPQNCMGDLGVEWNRFVHRWVMLYNCLNNTGAHPRGIYMRLAENPWSPWSVPQTIFNLIRDGGYCHFIHRAVTPERPACDDLSAPNRLAVPGGDYGPCFISRFTTGDEALGTSTFYYTLDTWNPYGQVIMKSTIQDESKH